MRRFLFLSLAAISLVTVACATVSQTPPEPDSIARVENGLLPSTIIKGENASMKLADRMAFYNVPGVSIAVINNGKLEWAKGYGVLEAGTTRPVTTETRFQAASISKPVAAMAALALVEQGKLNLDENVNLKLTSWHVPDNEFADRAPTGRAPSATEMAGTGRELFASMRAAVGPADQGASIFPAYVA